MQQYKALQVKARRESISVTKEANEAEEEDLFREFSQEKVPTSQSLQDTWRQSQAVYSEKISRNKSKVVIKSNSTTVETPKKPKTPKKKEKAKPVTTKPKSTRTSRKKKSSNDEDEDLSVFDF